MNGLKLLIIAASAAAALAVSLGAQATPSAAERNASFAADNASLG